MILKTETQCRIIAFATPTLDSWRSININVDREERGRSAAHGDACRAAEALFVSWVVEMGAWDVCEV